MMVMVGVGGAMRRREEAHSKIYGAIGISEAGNVRRQPSLSSAVSAVSCFPRRCLGA